MSIYKKLLEIQKSVRGFGKDKRGHNYDYVSGSKILSHIRAKMDDLGLLLKQEVLDIANQRHDYKTKFGEKSEILSKVDMRFTWIDVETGEKDVNLFGANGMNDFDKGVGSALTYAERYFLLKYFHIPTDEDDIDNPDSKAIPTDEDDKVPPPPVHKPQTITEKQFNSALARINKGEKDVIKTTQSHNIFIPPTQLQVLREAEKNYKPAK
ncbi:ERF family protein [Sphingobacterium sp. UT-1RO-CII-1]|uniref:ERF family protein n=1 Tax=Sphingobacterium sp. UT-1RO-CII-1 TaxID=2995225 RepID=UPI00227C99DD|nr:ERF family protein [Sphingobacterium sp. UT-1RO-CII-1]MCY4781463.1 ERF family protein [Sphingobacterium sp. UT-1RO-CII-1]